jgi:hypothetical protein
MGEARKIDPYITHEGVSSFQLLTSWARQYHAILQSVSLTTNNKMIRVWDDRRDILDSILQQGGSERSAGLNHVRIAKDMSDPLVRADSAGDFSDVDGAAALEEEMPLMSLLKPSSTKNVQRRNRLLVRKISSSRLRRPLHSSGWSFVLRWIRNKRLKK